MTVAGAGGERGLLARLIRPPRSRHVLVGPGDDAAVVTPTGTLELLTIDTVVEGEHFTLTHYTPRQIGRKALEVNVSDIAAMGGEPRHVLVALTLPRDLEVAAVEGLQAGINESADRYAIDVVGGDLTRGPIIVITIALSGHVSLDRLVRRDGARPGDIVMVSGGLGGAEAGRQVLLAGLTEFPDVVRRHLEPSARLDFAREVAGRVTAMEDVSDGLASEVRNICEASGVGATLRARDIPVDERVRETARALGTDPLDWALFGGEDYELVYTAPPALARSLPGVACGLVTRGRGLRLASAAGDAPLTRSGWDPFA